MRLSLRLTLLVSLIPLAALLAPATSGRASVDAIITVTTIDDELNYDGDCSLREAIQAANSNSPVDDCTAGISNDIIILPEGTITLSRPGTEENNNQSGDLDIRSNLIIQGAGRDLSIIDGNSIDRVFHVFMGTTIEIRQLTIQNGAAVDDLRGGGAVLNERTLTLQDVILKNNSASIVGGGIDNLGTLNVVDSTIASNQAEDGGGIFNSESGTLNLSSSALFGNIATTEFGGALDNSGSGTLVNITISDNTAQIGGGGIFSDGEFLSVLNSTVVANQTIENPLINGGNIESANEVRFINTLVANSQSGPNCAGSGFTSLGHNFDSENTCNFNQSTDLYDQGDPMIGLLQDNRGPTLTHALLRGSPAIDAGDNDVLVCPSSDQRGFFRPANGKGGGAAICDIGAYEYYMPVLIPLVLR